MKRVDKKGQMKIKNFQQSQKISEEIFSLPFSKNQKGQMKLSFGMIFSIILIIIFISFAFYAIMKFLSLQRSVQIGQFKDNVQTDIDRMWKGSQGSQEVNYILPTKITYACFIDLNLPAEGKQKNLYNDLKKVSYGEENLIFYPIGSAEGLDALTLNHIDIEKITGNENPLCFENSDGKVSFTIKKTYGEALVSISR